MRNWFDRKRERRNEEEALPAAQANHVASSKRLPKKDLPTLLAQASELLVAGEHVRYVAATAWNGLSIRAAVVTNGRVIGLPAKRRQYAEPVWVAADDIIDMKSAVAVGGVRLTITTSYVERAFGLFTNADVRELTAHVDQVRQGGVDPDVRKALAPLVTQVVALESARRAIQIYGVPLQEDEWEALDRHAAPGELPWLILSSEANLGILAAYDDRVVIAKINPAHMRPRPDTITQNLAGLAASISAILRQFIVTTFAFDQIRGIEYSAGLLSGELRVLTAGHPVPPTGGVVDWSAAVNVLPLAKVTYEHAVPAINELRSRIMRYRQPTGSSSPSTTGAMAGELEQLGHLHAAGVIDDEEFKAAKRAVIARNSK